MSAESVAPKATVGRLERLNWAVLLGAPSQIAMATMAGLALRLFKLRSVPPGLNQDEAVYGYDAYSILMTGRDHLGHPFPFASLETFGDWSSPLLTYLSIPAVAVFGLRVEVLRGVSALVGALAIPLVYFLALLLFKRFGVAVVSMWLIAVSPWAVHMSRWAIIPTVVPTMVAATVLVGVWALQHRNERAIVAAALLAALTVASYHAMKVYVPLVCLALAAVYWRELRRIRLEPLVYGAALFLAIAGPVLYLTVRDPGGGARLAQTSILNDHALTPALLINQYFSYFSARFWFGSGDGDPMHLPAGQGLEPLSLAPFLIAGLLWLFWTAVRGTDQWIRKGAMLAVLLIAFYPVPGMLTLPSPHVLRAVHVMPLAAIVAALGVVAAVDALRVGLAGQVKNWFLMPAAFTLVAILVFGSELTLRYESYFNRYPDEVAENFRYGMKDALQFVYQHEAEYDEVWIDDNNSSYIYVLFYRQWDPSDVHRNLAVRRNPPDWNRTDSIGKYHFGEPEDLQDRQRVFSAMHGVTKTGYEVQSGTLEGRRVLVVARTN